MQSTCKQASEGVVHASCWSVQEVDKVEVQHSAGCRALWRTLQVPRISPMHPRDTQVSDNVVCVSRRPVHEVVKGEVPDSTGCRALWGALQSMKLSHIQLLLYGTLCEYVCG